MKRSLPLIQLFLMLLIAGSASAQASFADRFNDPVFYSCDSILYQEYDGGSAWYPLSYTAFTTTSNDRFEVVRFYNDHGVFDSEYRSKRNSNGLVSEVEQHVNQGGTVSLFAAYIFTYSNSRVDTELYKTKDFFSGQLINSSRAIYTYDGNGNRTEILHQLYFNNTWENSYRDQFTYDGSNRLTSSNQDSYNSFSMNWEQATRSTYSYDGQNRLITKIEQEYNFSTSGWDNYQRLTYTDGSGFKETEEARWQNSNWVNLRKDVVIQDSQMREKGTTTYEWISGNWRLRYRSYCSDDPPAMPPASPTNLVATVTGTDAVTLTWTDNANNEHGTIIYHTFDTLGLWSIVDTVAPDVTTYIETGLMQDTTYFYALEAYNEAGLSLPSNIDSAFISKGVGITESFGPSFRFYPNPARNYLVLEGLRTIAGVKISATDLAGRTTNLLIQPNGAVAMIDLTTLKPGAYFLKIETGNKVRQEKLLITR